MCRDVCFAGDEFVSEAARQKTSQFPSVTTLFWKTITGSWVCFTAALTTGRNLGWWKERGGEEVSLKFFSGAERPQLCCYREHTVIIFTSARAKLLENSSQDRWHTEHKFRLESFFFLFLGPKSAFFGNSRGWLFARRGLLRSCCPCSHRASTSTKGTMGSSSRNMDIASRSRSRCART